MSALFHIQAPETDAHYLSGTGVWRFNEKKRRKTIIRETVKREYL